MYTFDNIIIIYSYNYYNNFSIMKIWININLCIYNNNYYYLYL